MKEQILELREKGYTYNQIVEELGCSKGTVSYHCNPEVKKKAYERIKKYREKNGHRKDLFSNRIHKIKNPFYYREVNRINAAKRIGTVPEPICWKRGQAIKKEKENRHKYKWRSKDLMKKIGSNPRCYLTGRSIDLDNSSTYHLDHIIPVAKGGNSSLENINICTREANLAKSDLLLEDFFQLCKDVLEHNGYIVLEPKD